MKLPQAQDLPIESETKTRDITQEDVDRFYKSFQYQSKYLPPTLGVVTLDSMFDLIGRLEIPNESLLHLSQSFHYLKPLSIPTRLKYSTKLIQIRARSAAAWTTFETTVFVDGETEPCAKTTSKVMVNLKDES